MRAASEFDRIASNIAIWHVYDSVARAELNSTCLMASAGCYLIDPIPLQREALHELIGPSKVAGIVITNSNHHRASAKFAADFSAPIFGHGEAFLDQPPLQFRSVADSDK